MENNVKTIPFWTDNVPAPAMYPWLDHNENCDVAVIGSGIAGVLCALKFAEGGVRTVLVGDEPVGYGSTGASPGVISYQLEGGINALADKIGFENAVAVYRLCAEGVETVSGLCGDLGDDAGYAKADCLYYTTSEKKRQKIHQEYLTRSHNGFDVEFLDENNAGALFSFPIKGGVLSRGLAAVVDPYRLTCALAQKARALGAMIFENTHIVSVDDSNAGTALHTAHGKTITAKKTILAAGSESAEHLGMYADVRTAFHVVTAPVPDFSGWYGPAALVSDGAPDIRLRTTPDMRIMISGLESGLAGVRKLSGLLPVESLKGKKYAELVGLLISMFPGIRDIRAEYQFASDYIRTCDKLPVIGQIENSSIYHCLCTGENGIAFAAVAARMLLDLWGGAPPEELALFSPLR